VANEIISLRKPRPGDLTPIERRSVIVEIAAAPRDTQTHNQRKGGNLRRHIKKTVKVSR